MMDQPDTSMINEGGFHQNEPASRAYIPPQPELRAPLRDFDQRFEQVRSRFKSPGPRKTRTAIIVGVIGTAAALWIARGGSFKSSSLPERTVRRAANKFRKGSSRSHLISRLGRESRKFARKRGLSSSRKTHAASQGSGSILGLLAVAAAIPPILRYTRRHSPQMMNGRLERMSFQRVYEKARKLNIAGRSVMNKEELIEAIREQQTF